MWYGSRIWGLENRHLIRNMCSTLSLRWRHNDHAGVSNHQPHGCLLNRLFRRKSKKTSKLRVTGLCAGNSPGTGEFPAQMASYAENVSIWWRHHVDIAWVSLRHDQGCHYTICLPHYQLFVWEIPRSTIDSPHQGPLMQRIWFCFVVSLPQTS